MLQNSNEKKLMMKAAFYKGRKIKDLRVETVVPAILAIHLKYILKKWQSSTEFRK